MRNESRHHRRKETDRDAEYARVRENRLGLDQMPRRASDVGRIHTHDTWADDDQSDERD